jgi:predicted component of type VI protein secretion system
MTKLARKWRGIALLAACHGFGCASRRPPAPAPAPAPVELTVQTSAETNDRRTLVLLVRALPKARFYDDEYDAIADLAVTPDDSVLARAVLVPSEVRKVSVAPPKAGALAVYFLFTRPAGENWRWLLPASANNPVVTLGCCGIVSPTIRATVVEPASGPVSAGASP